MFNHTNVSRLRNQPATKPFERLPQTFHSHPLCSNERQNTWHGAIPNEHIGKKVLELRINAALCTAICLASFDAEKKVDKKYNFRGLEVCSTKERRMKCSKMQKRFPDSQ